MRRSQDWIRLKAKRTESQMRRNLEWNSCSASEQPKNLPDPRRAKACNQTVMSGRITVRFVDFAAVSSSIAFALSCCGRFWCETGAVADPPEEAATTWRRLSQRIASAGQPNRGPIHRRRGAPPKDAPEIAQAQSRAQRTVPPLRFSSRASVHRAVPRRTPRCNPGTLC